MIGLFFQINWECHHPNGRTHMFQRGSYTTDQFMNLVFDVSFMDYHFLDLPSCPPGHQWP